MASISKGKAPKEPKTPKTPKAPIDAPVAVKVTRPDIPEPIESLKAKDIMQAAPATLTQSPAWCAMTIADRKLFWAIFEEIRMEATGFRTLAEIYQLTDLQFGLITERPEAGERTSKEEEARLKRQKAWLEQMEKLRKDKGEVVKGLDDIRAAMVAMKNKDGRVASWMIEFGDGTKITGTEEDL